MLLSTDNSEILVDFLFLPVSEFASNQVFLSHLSTFANPRAIIYLVLDLRNRILTLFRKDLNIY